jgi:outer membrane protein assembly factor BamB
MKQRGRAEVIREREPILISRHSPKTSAKDVIVVTTLDGWIHGVKKSNGEILWGIQQDPMIKVKSESKSQPKYTSNQELIVAQKGTTFNEKQTIFIAEPAGNGDLYYVEPGSAMKVSNF